MWSGRANVAQSDGFCTALHEYPKEKEAIKGINERK